MDILPQILFAATGATLLIAVYVIFTRGIPMLWKQPPKHELKYYIQLVRFLTLLAIAPFVGGVVSTFASMQRYAIGLAFALFISIFAVGMNTLMKNYYGDEAENYIEETCEKEEEE